MAHSCPYIQVLLGAFVVLAIHAPIEAVPAEVDAGHGITSRFSNSRTSCSPLRIAPPQPLYLCPQKNLSLPAYRTLHVGDMDQGLPVNTDQGRLCRTVADIRCPKIQSIFMPMAMIAAISIFNVLLLAS